MTWLAPNDDSPGRPAVFSDAVIKILFKLQLSKRLEWWSAC